MAITTDASIAQAKTTMLGQELIQQLSYNNILAQFLQSDTNFVGDTGAYTQGATISLPVTPSITTNIVTATGGAVSYPKQTLTNVSLTLDYIASTPFSINQADQALANINPENGTLQNAAKEHGNAIEEQLMLSCFNHSTINGNVIGAAGTDGNYKLLRTLWQAFFDANVPDSQTKVVVLPSDIYSELLADSTVSRLANPENSRTLSTGVILDTLNMVVLPSRAATVKVGTDYDNLSALGAVSTPVGFAFTTDSIVAAVRELQTVSTDMGVNQVVIRDNNVNLATRLTKSYNPDVIGGDVKYHMETLFGAQIYRPTTVFPILGGIA